LREFFGPFAHGLPVGTVESPTIPSANSDSLLDRAAPR